MHLLNLFRFRMNYRKTILETFNRFLFLWKFHCVKNVEIYIEVLSWLHILMKLHHTLHSVIMIHLSLHTFFIQLQISIGNGILKKNWCATRITFCTLNYSRIYFIISITFIFNLNFLCFAVDELPAFIIVAII